MLLLFTDHYIIDEFKRKYASRSYSLNCRKKVVFSAIPDQILGYILTK